MSLLETLRKSPVMTPTLHKACFGFIRQRQRFAKRMSGQTNTVGEERPISTPRYVLIYTSIYEFTHIRFMSVYENSLNYYCFLLSTTIERSTYSNLVFVVCWKTCSLGSCGNKRWILRCASTFKFYIKNGLSLTNPSSFSRTVISQIYVTKSL